MRLRKPPASVPWVQADPPWIPHGERAKLYEAEDSLPVPTCKRCGGEVYYEKGAWHPEGCEPLIARSTGTTGTRFRYD